MRVQKVPTVQNPTNKDVDKQNNARAKLSRKQCVCDTDLFGQPYPGCEWCGGEFESQ